MKEQKPRNVWEAANERLKLIFNDFDNVLVALSCGKDSGVMLNMAYKYAKENNLLHKLSVYYEDYEADYKFTHEYADRMFQYLQVEKKYWLCLPISAACSVSMYEPRWIPWDRDKKELWVRDMPDYDFVVNEHNCPYEFIKGTKGFDARIQFSEWFGKKYGSTAVLIGLRAQESLTRRAIFTSKHRKLMHKGLTYSKTVDKNTTNFYPLYDWLTEDIWVANYKYEFDYNKIYDLYWQAGLTVDQMRVASPFHQSGQENLKLYKTIDPNSWGKMLGRVNGVNFGGLYGGTTAMGWKTLTKPKHFTWKEYANFLLTTLPEGFKKKVVENLERFQKTWKEKGYGRNPRVIATMIKEGIIVENTHKISKLCTKDDIYEIIKIKSDFPEDTSISDFRHCPSWKAICATIMKNDYALQYMGCSRTKDQNIIRQKALERYGKLKLTKEQAKNLKEIEEDYEE